MEQRRLGRIGKASVLALGGGGIGNVWGEVTREEAIDATRYALDAGITLFDMAPGYGNGEAEKVFGKSFAGQLPDNIIVTTKCWLQADDLEDIPEVFRQSLVSSLERMRLDQVDIFFLHNPIIPDERTGQYTGVPYSRFVSDVVPAMHRLIDDGLARHWGITGVGVPSNIIDIMNSSTPPDVIQAITNILDAPADLKTFEEPARPREIIEVARQQDIGVMGIRAVGAGALADHLDRDLPEDHPVSRDYRRAEPFRQLAYQLHTTPAALAHRYAISMSGVSTVVLGAKNRNEIRECIHAANDGVLSREVITEIDNVWTLQE